MTEQKQKLMEEKDSFTVIIASSESIDEKLEKDGAILLSNELIASMIDEQEVPHWRHSRRNTDEYTTGYQDALENISKMLKDQLFIKKALEKACYINTLKFKAGE